jgi:hypothetical protein
MRFDPETGEAIIETQFDPEPSVLEEKLVVFLQLVWHILTESDDK